MGFCIITFIILFFPYSVFQFIFLSFIPAKPSSWFKEELYQVVVSFCEWSHESEEVSHVIFVV